MIGRTLSHYEVLGQLGSGGMGEVYRARDTRLGREVAIKVLPAEFARDESRLARFQREATLLASLSHPSIATLYGLEEASGLRFLVMELVEGEDLSSRLNRGPLSVGETLEVAAEIASGLEAAHAKGVIHRDLKPGNIRIAPDGTVKVLDFGLGKAMVQDEGPRDLSRSPTMLSADRTVEGVILGTAAYMSPEQARGKPLDRRTDIWSFGCVLYECLTGRQAFSGETVTDTLAKILERDPDWDAVPAAAPPALRNLLRRCLEKDPNKRWRDMGDVGIILDQAGDEMRHREVVSASPANVGAPRIRLVLASVAVVLSVSAYFLGQMSGRRQADRDAPRAHRLSFTQLTVQSGMEQAPSISPDGSFIVYQCLHEGNWDIFLQRIGGYKPISLTEDSAEDDVSPAYSPDGQLIAFRSDRQGGGIFIMGSTGESVRRVSDFGHDPSWSPDGGKIVFATEGVVNPLARNIVSQLWTLDVRTGEKIKIADGDAVQPSWSPHGYRIACWGLPGGGGAQRDLYTVGAGGGDSVAVTADLAVDWSPVWSPDGAYLYFVSDRGGTMNIWRVPIDEESGRTLGSPEPLTAPTSYVAEFDVSRDGGSLVYTDLRATSNISKASFDPVSGRAGAASSVTRGSVYLMDPDVAPDGRWVVCRSGGREDLYLVRGDGAEMRKLTDDPYRDRGPRWSSDGTQIAFYSDRGGRYEIWSIRPDGSSLKQLTQTEAGIYWFPVFSPDDTKLLVCDAHGSYVLDLRQIPVNLAIADTLPSVGDGDAFQGRTWSRDGRFVAGCAYRSDGSPGPGVFVYSFETRTYRRFCGDLTPIIKMAWVGDNRHLVFPHGGSLYLLDTATGTRKVLLDGVSALDLEVSTTPDGSQMYFVQGGVETDVWQARIEE